MMCFPSPPSSFLGPSRDEKRSERGVPIISYIVIYEREKERAIGREQGAIGKKKRGQRATKAGSARETLGLCVWGLGGKKIKWIRQSGMGVTMACYLLCSVETETQEFRASGK